MHLTFCDHCVAVLEQACDSALWFTLLVSTVPDGYRLCFCVVALGLLTQCHSQPNNTLASKSPWMYTK